MSRRRMIIDGHLDLAWNAIDWKRNLNSSVEEIRAREVEMTQAGRGRNTVSLSALAEAHVAICFATVLARMDLPGNLNLVSGCATAEATYAVGQSHVAYYVAMERAGRLRMIRTKSDLDAHLTEWESRQTTAPLGCVLAMEGADPILDPSQLADWHAQGLRLMSLTHYGENRYGGGTHTKTPLAADAFTLLNQIEHVGIGLDLTHLSDEAFWQAVDTFAGVVFASHQNARRFVNDQRQFSDEQLKIVIERNGVVGAALDAWMLQPNFKRGVTQPEITLDRVAENIDHVCQLAGDTRHAAFGTDLDGGFGAEQTPVDLDTVCDLPRLAEPLLKRGYTEDDLDRIFARNWIDLLRRVLPS